MKKSSGLATVQGLFLVLFLILFLYLFLTTITAELNKRHISNLRATEIAKLENTFTLLNRSIGMTWYISTVQSIFQIYDQSLGCNDDSLQKNFWYQYDGKSQKLHSKIDGFFESVDFGGSESKNDFPPYLCYPSVKILVNMINEKFEPYNTVKENFESDGLPVEISDTQTAFSLSRDGVTARSTQDVKIGGRIDEQTENVNKVYTELQKIMNFGRGVVLLLAKVSDSFLKDGASDANYDFAARYQDINLQHFINVPGDNATESKSGNASYLDRIAGRIDFPIKVLVQTNELSKARLKLEKNNFELFAAKKGDAPIFGETPDNFKDGVGVVLHYNYTLKLSEFASICQTPPNDYGTLIQNAVQEQDWGFSTGGLLLFGPENIEYTNEEIVQLLSGIVERESGWNARAISDCGAAGLGQLMPGTARAYGQEAGLDRIFENSYSIACDGGYAGRLRNAIAGKTDAEIVGIDERFDPEKNIFAAVNYVHFLLERVIDDKDYTDDREEALKLATAAYNTGEENLDQAVERAKSERGIDGEHVKYDDIAIYLAGETQDYVPAVMGFYACYGGFVSSIGGSYYFHNQADNKFVKRPFATEIKVEDYLPAINCREHPYSSSGDLYLVSIINATRTESLLTPEDKFFLDNDRQFSWKAPPAQSAAFSGLGVPFYEGDVVCCGGVLWSCDVDVPDIPASQKLGAGSKLTGINRDVTGLAATACDDAINPIKPATGGDPGRVVRSWELRCTCQDATCDKTQFFHILRICTGGECSP